MEHYPLIRTIYLYLFALVGLALIIIGSVKFVDMGLKAFIFTQAEQEEKIYNAQPPMPRSIEKIEKIGEEGEQAAVEFSEEERILISEWLNDYKNWKERSEGVNFVTARRHRQASSNLAMILIGLPLFLYHWGIIRRETRKNREK